MPQMNTSMGRVPPVAPSPKEEKKCYRKMRHDTRDLAEQHRNELIEKGVTDFSRLEVYPCGDHFHVGHITRRKFRRLKSAKSKEKKQGTARR